MYEQKNACGYREAPLGSEQPESFLLLFSISSSKASCKDKLPTSVEVVRAGTGADVATVVSPDNSTGVNGGDIGRT